MNWQPIETAPRDGTTILLFEPGWPHPWQRVHAARWLEAKQRFESSYLHHPVATHWQPIQEPQ